VTGAISGAIRNVGAFQTELELSFTCEAVKSPLEGIWNITMFL
jgi:hypothetical protein